MTKPRKRVSAAGERKPGANARYERFISEYIIDFNGARAARAAGYSEKTAREQAVVLLANPHIRAEVDRRAREVLEHTGDVALKAYQELQRLAFSDMRDFIEFDEDGNFVGIKIPDNEHTKEIQEITQDDRVIKSTDENEIINRKLKLKLHDKKGSLDQLARIAGLVKDKIEISFDDKEADENRKKFRDLLNAKSKK